MPCVQNARDIFRLKEIAGERAAVSNVRIECATHDYNAGLGPRGRVQGTHIPNEGLRPAGRKRRKRGGRGRRGRRQRVSE